MFCMVLESAFDDAGDDLKSEEHVKAIRDLYVGKIFIVKKIDNNRKLVHFYVDQDHRDSLNKINVFYGDQHLRVDSNYTPRAYKKHFVFLTFVDIWELKREGKYAVYK